MSAAFAGSSPACVANTKWKNLVCVSTSLKFGSGFTILDKLSLNCPKMVPMIVFLTASSLASSFLSALRSPKVKVS
jgi:hypothetical protein